MTFRTHVATNSVFSCLLQQTVDNGTVKTMTNTWNKVKAIPNYEEEAGSVLFQK